MQINDGKVDPAAGLAAKLATIPLAPAINLTNRLVGVIRPGHGFKVLSGSVFASAVTATVSVDAFIAGASERITATTMSTHSTPEQMACTAFRVRVGGKYVEKGAATAITFSAAHVVTASKYGIILLQIDNAGTISTKVPASTQAYDTAAAARAATPTADSGKLAIADLLIQNNAGDWTANTDDLTAASDLTLATYTNYAATVTSLFTGAITPVAFERVAGTLASSPAVTRTSDATKDVLVIATTNGTGALTSGAFTLAYRPYPAYGENA